ncbi:MAG: hypothetical protein A2052_07245 [Deltaproteobacteria bacterium GWA2_54_12]|nr:MAG: hypothetical protein A2052_07245 [Deltaproteobacteria bacterium GWA2_54_12]
MAEGFASFLLILAATPLWIMVLQAFLTRVGFRRASGQATAMLASAIAALPTGAALWAVHLSVLDGPELRASALYALLAYALLAYSYFHLFNMGETARRVRILVELRERGNISVEELKSFYDAGAILDRRLERLVALGQVRLEGGRIVLKSRRLYWAAVVINWWGRILSLPSLKSFYKNDGR